MIEIDIITKSKFWKTELPNYKKIPLIIADKTLTQVDFNKYADYIEFSVIFADDNYIRKLNREFQGKDKSTNVLSFPSEDIVPNEFDKLVIDDRSIILGDIIVAFETIKFEAEEANISFENHLYHLLIHGLLHLLGFDHISCDEAEQMEKLEIDILKIWSIDSPYK